MIQDSFVCTPWATRAALILALETYANLRRHVKFLPHASNLFESDKATLINYLVYVGHLVHLSDFGYMPVATA
jgi:hypothetical protein